MGDRQARIFYLFYSLKGCGYHLPNSSMKPPLKRGKLHNNTGNNLSFDGAVIIRPSEMRKWCQDTQHLHFTVFSAFVVEL